MGNLQSTAQSFENTAQQYSLLYLALLIIKDRKTELRSNFLTQNPVGISATINRFSCNFDKENPRGFVTMLE